MNKFHESYVYRVAYLTKILNSGGTINKDKVMLTFSVSQKTIERNMITVIDIMREIYDKIVVWDGTAKVYYVDKG